MHFFARVSKLRKTIFLVLGLLIPAGLVAFGLWGFWSQYNATHQRNVSIPSQTLTHTTKSPAETPPRDACRDYKVADDKPRKIIITSIGIDACIQPVGVDQHKNITAPSNIHLAGWFTQSAVPGNAGVSLIDGHVSGRYDRNAVFAKLANVQKDAAIRIQYGDMSWKEFVVTGNTSYPVSEIMDHALQPTDPTQAELNLVTCDGLYANGAYPKRILIQSRLAQAEFM